jgi:hypothetical protein
MFEANYKSIDGRITVKFTGDDNKNLFEQIAKFDEIFCNNLTCKNCQKNETRLNVRDVDSNKYYERVCNGCGFTFSFGQHKKGGTLFPKYDKGKGGWSKWVPEDNDNSSAKTTAAPTKSKK